MVAAPVIPHEHAAPPHAAAAQSPVPGSVGASQPAPNAGGYRIDRTDGERRQQVEAWLFGLHLVSDKTREAIVTAWTSAWVSSSYLTLEDMSFSPLVDYPLMKHVNEVTRFGIEMARHAAVEWGVQVDNDTLVAALALHDVDMPLMCARTHHGIEYTKLSRELPHGTVAAMIARDVGLPHVVVSALATHAENAPFHAESFESYIVKYADDFVTDHVLMSLGKRPLFQAKRRS